MGKGSQGQIYTSLHSPTMKIYAMKRVRCIGDAEIVRELSALVDLCRFADVCPFGTIRARRTLLRSCRACCCYNRYSFIKGCVWAHVSEPVATGLIEMETPSVARRGNRSINAHLSDLLNVETHSRAITPTRACPYVVQFYDSFPASSPESQCFVMEYMGCGSLKSLLSFGKDFTEPEGAIIAYSILHALHHINSKGYIHGDIKPSNVLLDSSGCVKLSDFGSACKLDSDTTTRNRQTTGTMAYMPPELFDPERGITKQSDIWSMGMMLLHLLRGTHPFAEARNYWCMRGAILEATFASMLGDYTFTPELESFLSRCLVRDVTDRACVKELLQSPFLQRAAAEGILPSSRCSQHFEGDTEEDIPRLAALIQEEQYKSLFRPEADIIATILSERQFR